MVSQTTTPQAEYSTGKGCITAFFLGFVFLGVLLGITIGIDLYSVIETYTWQAHEATVIESEVLRHTDSITDDHPYKLNVRYHYVVDGIPYDSMRINFSKPHFAEYDEAEAISRQYPPDSTQTIYYNPDIPHESILYHESIVGGFLLLLPLFSVAVGVLGLLIVWWPGRKKQADSLSRQAMSRSQQGVFPRSVLLMTGALFFFGGIYYTIDAAKEFKSFWHIDSFTPIDCSIHASEIVRHVSTNDDGDSSISYTPDVFYSCAANGLEIRSNKFRFFKYGGSSYQAVESLIEQYPAGETVVGWQNPEHLDEVILHKAPGTGLYFALIPLVCVIVGLGFLSVGLSPRRKHHGTPDTNAGGSRPQKGGELIPASSRRGVLLFYLGMAVFWNGVVSVFLYELYQSILQGSPALFLALFLIPFVIAGIVLLVLAGKEFITLFNPVVRVHVSNVNPRLGETIRLQWHVEGKASRLSNIVMLLEGEERATYRRGTETTTSTSTFFRKRLNEDLHGRDLSRGSCSARIPEESMHSFHAMHNEIVWKIIVRGEILRWPDAVDTYSIEVGPAGGDDANTGS